MKTENFILPVGTFHSMFDADGSIYAEYIKIQRKNGLFYVNVQWKYSFSQGQMNTMNVKVIAELLARKVGTKRRLTGRDAGKIEITCGGTMLSKSGQFILSMYKETPPRTFSRLQQFLACEYCTTQIASTDDERNLIRELLIADYISTERKQDVEPIIREFQEKNNISSNLIAEARLLAADDIRMLEEKCMKIWNNVPNIIYNDDNIRGVFVADGTVGIGYVLSSGKLDFRPIFSVTNMHKEPCLALKKTFGKGSVTRSGRNAFQFRTTGTEFFRNVLLPIFENVHLGSEYKQQQWDRTWEVVQMLERQEHKNFDGFCKIIDESYDISGVNRRKFPIDYYKNPALMKKRRR